MEKADGKITGSYWLKWVLVACSCSFFWLEYSTPSSGFPHGSTGKESACNSGDPSSIPGSGRSPGEEIGYPLQCPWASLVAQRVKNPPAMQETWVPGLGWKDTLEKGKATHSSFLAWRIPWGIYSPWGHGVGHA